MNADPWSQCGRPDIGQAIGEQGLPAYTKAGRASDVVWALTRHGVIPAADHLRLVDALAAEIPEIPAKAHAADGSAWHVAYYGVVCIASHAVWLAEQRGVNAYGAEAKAIATAAQSAAWERMAAVAARFVEVSR